jgi:hypothetical protein
VLAFLPLTVCRETISAILHMCCACVTNLVSVYFCFCLRRCSCLWLGLSAPHIYWSARGYGRRTCEDKKDRAVSKETVSCKQASRRRHRHSDRRDDTHSTRRFRRADKSMGIVPVCRLLCPLLIGQQSGSGSYSLVTSASVHTCTPMPTRAHDEQRFW